MKKYILPILFFALCIATIAGVHFRALALMASCGTLRIDNACLVQKVSDRVMDDPSLARKDMVELASLRRLNLAGGDFRAYGMPLHHLGAMLASNGVLFSSLSHDCPALLKDGCVHGYVMEYVRERGMAAASTLCNTTDNKRLQLGCMHAIGHSYLETFDGSLTSAVYNFCAGYIGDKNLACVSGLFHEYTKGGEGMGMDDYYDRPRTYVPLPCYSFSDKGLQTVCFGAEGSFRQYYAGSEPVADTYAFCDRTPTAESRAACRAEADERIVLSKGYSSVQP